MLFVYFKSCCLYIFSHSIMWSKPMFKWCTLWKYKWILSMQVSWLIYLCFFLCCYLYMHICVQVLNVVLNKHNYILNSHSLISQIKFNSVIELLTHCCFLNLDHNLLSSCEDLTRYSSRSLFKTKKMWFDDLLTDTIFYDHFTLVWPLFYSYMSG